MSPRARLAQPFQVECRYSALPAPDADSFGAVLERAGALVQRERLEDAVAELDELIERQQEDFSQQVMRTGERGVGHAGLARRP